MERSPLLLLFLLLLPGISPAQSWFIEAHGTYQSSIGGLGASEEHWTVPSDGGPRTARLERVNLNWGRGYGGGLVVGRSLNEHLGVEIRATYLASRTEWEYEGGYEERDDAINMQYLRVEPALRVRSSQGKLDMYLALGPSLAVFPLSIYTSKSIVYAFNGPYNNEYEQHQFGGIGWGGFGAVGCARMIGKHLAIQVELNATAQSWSPDRAETRAYVSLGIDRIPNMGTSDLITEYVNELTLGDDLDTDSPSKALRLNYPMSTWGVRVGVSYVFTRSQGKGEPR